MKSVKHFKDLSSPELVVEYLDDLKADLLLAGFSDTEAELKAIEFYRFKCSSRNTIVAQEKKDKQDKVG